MHFKFENFVFSANSKISIGPLLTISICFSRASILNVAALENRLIKLVLFQSPIADESGSDAQVGGGLLLHRIKHVDREYREQSYEEQSDFHERYPL